MGEKPTDELATQLAAWLVVAVTLHGIYYG